MSELTRLTIHETHDLLRRRQTSAVELTQAYLQRIEQVDGRVKAFLHVAPELALAQAEDADRRRAAGEDNPLLGIPLAIKDMITVRGMPTTAGSRILAGFMPPYESTAVARLRQLGAVFLGKVNTDEFAMGWSTETSAFFTTHNPYDLTRVPGGSSGGSAAAVAADLATAALGTDTGGSVRQPASWTNTVGLRPTYGRVSRWGVVAFASSLDQIGPITKDVRDNAILLDRHRRSRPTRQHDHAGASDRLCIGAGGGDQGHAPGVAPRISRGRNASRRSRRHHGSGKTTHRPGR